MYRGKKVILRAFEKSDTAAAHKLFNNLEVQRLLNPRIVLPLSFTAEEQFVTDAMEAKNPDVTFQFAVTDLKGRFIGSCSYLERDSRNGTCFIGISIADPKYQSKGYGTDALRVLLGILFNELNIRKVLLYVFDYNARAIACYKKLGFKEEGRLKEHIWREGGYHDNIIMALFARDFTGRPG